jgi:HlyD family secretion protein
MKFSLKTLIWGTLLVAVALVAGFALFPKPLEVESAKAVLQPLRVTVQEDGKTRIREKYVVSAPVSGRLSRIELKAGDRCDLNSLLAVILPSDPAMLDARARAEAIAQVQAAEATLQRAVASAEQTKIAHELNTAKLNRSQSLRPSQAISQEEYDIARTESQASALAIKTANFDVEIAQFELEMARAAAHQFSDDMTSDKASTSVSPFEIFAPISGKVLHVFEKSSTVVAVGAPLIEIGDPHNLEIEIDVLSTDAVRIAPGAELTIEHWGGTSPLVGNVRVIEPGAFTKISSLGVEEQRVNIIADFNEPPERLATLGDGYRVEARITVNELDRALQIPNSALFRHQRQWHVLAIEAGRAVLRAVTIGLQNETHTQIIDGLVADERVIIYPSDTLQPGARVMTAY